MKAPKIKKIIILNTNKDWANIQKSILIPYFNLLGSYNVDHTDRIIFKLRAEKANEPNISGRTHSDFFKVLRLVEMKPIKFEKNKIQLKISISLLYLLILSIGLGISYYLGMIFFIYKMGIMVYLTLGIITTILTFIIGLINITIRMDSLTNYLRKEVK